MIDYVDPRIVSALRSDNVRTLLEGGSASTAHGELDSALEAAQGGGLRRACRATRMPLEAYLIELLTEAAAGVDLMSRAEMALPQKRVVHRGLVAALDEVEALLTEAVNELRRLDKA